MGGTIRVWANETRGTAGAKGSCKHCGAPITWFTTVRNNRAIPLDSHEPVPLFSERDLETGRTMEAYGRELVHFGTCTKRTEARA
jgi:hypothetical protein